MEEKKPVILMAGETLDDLRILAHHLEADYYVKMAENGEEVLRAGLSRNPPDLIILDIAMPGPDGFEVCRRLKAMPKTRDIPVIFMTSQDREEDEEYGLSLGAIDYITKPFRIPIVRARVNNHVELKLYRDMLKNNSMSDHLTLISNRRGFDEIILWEWNKMRRRNRDLSLIMIDIDDFKKYNDTYGHLAGDDCLKRVAEALKTGVRRDTDVVVRRGSEEFVCILPETGKEEAIDIADRLRLRVADLRIPHAGSRITDVVTVSLGVSTIRPKADTGVTALIERADRALYRAKSNGGNQVYRIGRERNRTSEHDFET